MTSLLLFLSPFVQLGVSYYASVATLLLLLSVTNWWVEISSGIARASLMLAIVLFMPLPLAALPSFDLQGDLLRILREAVMLIILVGAICGFRFAAKISHSDLSLPKIGIVVGFFVLMALIQTVFYPRGVYFGFPEASFAQETGTIANDAALTYNAQNLRPNGTFAEPSYFAFVLLSFAMMVLPRTGSSRLANALLGGIIIAGLLSRSLAFLLSLILVILVPLMFESRRNRLALAAGTIVPLVALLAFTRAGTMVQRLFEAGADISTDMSAAARIVGPISAIPGYLAEYPAGVPATVVSRALVPFLTDRSLQPEEILNNALFNLVFAYGFIGIAIIGIVLFSAKDMRVRLYLIACTMFNGAFLAIDKVAIISMALAIYEGGRRAYPSVIRSPLVRRGVEGMAAARMVRRKPQQGSRFGANS
jgi:hypothetical protein